MTISFLVPSINLLVSLLLLQTVWGKSIYAESQSSRQCKTECIDQGNFHCTTNQYGLEGLCCDSPTDCRPRDSSLCSFDSPVIGLAYQTCPRDYEVCGSRELISVQEDKVNALALYAEWTGGAFNNGMVCRYQLEYPYRAEIHDQLIVEVALMDNAIAYLVETERFDSDSPRQELLKESKATFTATFPNKVYLTVVADMSDNPAEWELNFSYNDRDGDAIEAVLQAERDRMEDIRKAEEEASAEQARIEEEQRLIDEAREKAEQEAERAKQKEEAASTEEVAETEEIIIREVITIQRGFNESDQESGSLSSTTLTVLLSLLGAVIVTLLIVLIIARRKQLQNEASQIESETGHKHPVTSKSGKVAPLPQTESASAAMDDQTQQPTHRKNMFEVSNGGVSVKINPALLTMDNSLKRGGGPGSDADSGRFSQIMSTYNDKHRSRHHDVGQHYDKGHLPEVTINDSETDNYRLGSIMNSPQGSRLEMRGISNAGFQSMMTHHAQETLELPAINRHGQQLVTISPTKTNTLFGIGARSKPDLGIYDNDIVANEMLIEGTPVKSHQFSVKNFDIVSLDVEGQQAPEMLNIVEGVNSDAEDEYIAGQNARTNYPTESKKKEKRDVWQNKTMEGPRLGLSFQVLQNTQTNNSLQGFDHNYNDSVTFQSSQHGAKSRKSKNNKKKSLNFSIEQAIGLKMEEEINATEQVEGPDLMAHEDKLSSSLKKQTQPVLLFGQNTGVANLH